MDDNSAMTSAEGSARILTFLIADIRGYTSFTQRRGDEAAADLASTFAQIVREGIEAHGGELIELRGDEALAVFASARSSLRAAAALQGVFEDETALHPERPMVVGIGLDAGEAVAVEGGYRGGALNLAARLCSLATGGESLASEGVVHLARAVDGLEITEWGYAELKGLAQPVRAYRVNALGPAVGVCARRVAELPVQLDGASPMVGRERELRRLSWLWRTTRRGSGSRVVVRGPAGSGKSRLLAALAGIAAQGGGQCHYLSMAVPTGFREWCSAVEGPALVVLDDVDSGSDEDLELLAQAMRGPQIMFALAVNDEHASDAMLRTVRHLAGDDIRLPPLDIEQMRQLAGLYLPAAAELIPTELLNEAAGNPRRVHQVVSDWVDADGTRRLGMLVRRATSGRHDLRSAESDLAGTVVDLQLARERARLFGLRSPSQLSEPSFVPYRGLASFDVEDADSFFGRERLVAELVAKLAGAPLLGVVGPSGSGKSSVVRGGLVPALRSGVLPGSEAWTTVVMRPGERPLRALDRAVLPVLPNDVVAHLADNGSVLAEAATAMQHGQRLVVVVDQFEEAFTLCLDESERSGFIAALTDAAIHDGARVTVVLTIRAEFYGRCAAEPALADLLASNHVLIGAMSAEEYRRAIVNPAVQAGVAVEAELVDALVDDVLGEPGPLPLLSTTLLQLWNGRAGGAMSLSDYAATGGVRGAVARLAETVYAEFSVEQKALVRPILLRLAGPGEGDAVVRRRVSLADFDSARNDDMSAVLEALADRRLLTVSDGTVEVAHEALLREWPRVRDWLQEDREGLRLRAHLATAAQEWLHADRDPGELYRGARLSAALDWTAQHSLDLNGAEREFVTSSRAEAQRTLTRQHRQNRRLRGLLAGAAMLLVLAVTAALLALSARSAANRAAAEARHEALSADAGRLAALAATAPDIATSALLAVAAYRLQDSSDTRGALLSALQRGQSALFRIATPGRIIRLVGSTDGTRVYALDNTATVHVIDTVRRVIIASYPDASDVVGVTRSGTDLVVEGTDDRLHVLAAADGHTVRDLLGTTEGFDAAGMAPGGRWLVADLPPDPNHPGRTIAVYDADDWLRAPRTLLLPAPVIEIAAGRQLLAAETADRIVYLINPATMRIIGHAHRSDLPTTDDAINAGLPFALAPDGRHLSYVRGPDGTTPVVLDTARLGEAATPLPRQPEPVSVLGFSNEGSQLVAGSAGGSVNVYKTATGSLVAALAGEAGAVTGAAWAASPHGTQLFTAGRDSKVVSWDVAETSRLLHLTGPSLPSAVVAERFGDHIIGGWPSLEGLTPGTAERLFDLDLRTGAERSWPAELAAPEIISAVSATPDGSRGMVSIQNVDNGTSRWQLWDFERGVLLRNLTPPRSADQSHYVAATISPNGQSAVAALGDGRLGVLALPSGRLERSIAAAFREPGTSQLLVEPSQFNPNGLLMITGRDLGPPTPADQTPGAAADPPSVNNRIGLLDVRTARMSAQAGLGDGAVNAIAWSHNAQLLVIGTTSGALDLFDAHTLRLSRSAANAQIGDVLTASFSPDDRTIVTAGDDAAMNLWAVDTLTREGTRMTVAGSSSSWWAWYAPGGSLSGLAPDASHPGLDDERAFTFPAQSSDWVHLDCSLAASDLTRAEWAGYVGDQPYRHVC